MSEMVERTPDDAVVQEVTPEEPQVESLPIQQEPHWLKKRLEREVSKAVADTEARMNAHFEELLAPYKEAQYEHEAQKLVDEGEFKSKERALEYVKLKGGVPVEKPVDPMVNARADILAQQANKLKARGADVLSVYNNDPEIKGKVLSGEWDFYDVYENMDKPQISRTPGSVDTGARSIEEMSDAQFKKLQENLARGKTYQV